MKLYILSYMTKEQYCKMHLEIVNELEEQGFLCVSCRIKKFERTQYKYVAQSERLGTIQMDLSHCACLLKRPRVFSLIGYIWKQLGDMLLPAYFAKKAAQASNDAGYPVQALNYAFAAEELLPYQSDAFIADHEMKDNQDFDLSVLKASVRKVKAKSCFLLGNTYEAASFIQKALSIVGLDLIHLHGIYNSKQFKEVLEMFPLLQAEFLTKVIGILAQTYILAEKYESASIVLKMEFIALSLYPIDFLQILNFNISLYRCKNGLKPGKQFETLENNTFQICNSRLEEFGATLNLLDIQCIFRAYTTIIETNLKNDRLSRAEKIAKDALVVLRYLNMKIAIPCIYIYLIEIYLHQDRNMDYFECIDNLDYNVDETVPLEILSLYMCALSHIMILKLTDGTKRDASDESKIKKCNEFAFNLTESRLSLLNTDISLYVSTKMSLWCIKSGQLCNWSNSNKVFSQCYAEGMGTLSETWSAKTYWDVGALLLLYRIKLFKFAGNNAKEMCSSVLEELQQIKKIVKTNFPVYIEKYQRLVKDINTLKSGQLLDTF